MLQLQTPSMMQTVVLKIVFALLYLCYECFKYVIIATLIASSVERRQCAQWNTNDVPVSMFFFLDNDEVRHHHGFQTAERSATVLSK